MPPLRLHAPSRRDAVVVETPVLLAPMAGVTNASYRKLCYEQGAGVCVCEMITSRGLVIGDLKTADMLTFWPDEPIRSAQLYGAEPKSMAYAAEVLCESFNVHHIDLNFGCPVPKVTRKGGGGVLPWKLELMREILTATVAAADKYGVPVTMKTRIGIDDAHETMLDAGRIAQESGIAAICLHARTTQQAYGGAADWSAISRLIEAVDIPVIGNGDIWEARDAVAMVRQTGCAAVEVGRGCLGRPWLFRDLARALGPHGDQAIDEPTLPTLGEVAAMVRRHGELLVELRGEHWGMCDLRKHMAWYFKGFPLGGELRHTFGLVTSLEHLDSLLAELDPTLPFPVQEIGKARGRQGSPRGKVTMPYGWLDDRDGRNLDLSAAEEDVSGG